MRIFLIGKAVVLSVYKSRPPPWVPIYEETIEDYWHKPFSDEKKYITRWSFEFGRWRYVLFDKNKNVSTIPDPVALEIISVSEWNPRRSLK